MPRRRINPLTSYGVPVRGGGVLQANTEYQWFVDYNWDKGFGDGRTQDRPLKYLQDAIDQTVAHRGDVIYVGRSYTPITSTLAFNKIGISVIAMEYGMNTKMQGEYFCHDFSTTTTEPAAIITQPCFIHGLGFHTGWAAAGSYQVLIDNNIYGTHLHNCRFTDWATGCDYGLQLNACKNTLIEDCSFEGNADSPTRFVAGIAQSTTATNNAMNNQVKDCTFTYCTNAIHHIGSSAPMNVQYGPGNITTEVGTKFLHSRAGSGNGMVFGNFFCTAEGTATYDLTVANIETAGIMCTGNEYSTEGPGPT